MYIFISDIDIFAYLNYQFKNANQNVPQNTNVKIVELKGHLHFLPYMKYLVSLPHFMVPYPYLSSI